jgi:hypothetical protein
VISARHGEHVVCWDGDFRFGAQDVGAPEVMQVAPSRAVGAAFLSGRGASPVVHVDESAVSIGFNVSGPLVEMASRPSSFSSLALCGPGVANPRIVADQCRSSGVLSVSVCPLLGFAAPFGCVAGALLLKGMERPRGTRFCAPMDEPLDAEGVDFNPEMEGDGLGRMAHLVQTRMPVFNQMMTTPSIPAFYGRVLSTGRWWGDPIFLMLPRTALRYFPEEPISLRNYAARWVPVSLANTDEFGRASGYGASWVTVFVASELTPGLGTFLRFLETMCREDFVASSDPSSVPPPSRIPLFRSRRAYNVGEKQFMEAAIESRGFLR